MTLGQKITQLRLTHSLSQEELAGKLDVSRQTVSKWELDQTYPELPKIVKLSRLFSVTTDDLLVNGISTFEDTDIFICGIYRSSECEIAETEKFALVYYNDVNRNVLGTKLYMGLDRKYLTAVCERDLANSITSYAYKTNSGQIVSNGDLLKERIGELYDSGKKNSMHRREKFSVDHSGTKMPTVSEAGIPACLRKWRFADSYSANEYEFSFSLCTDKTEYIFSIQTSDSNIYCGASYNTVFDMGLFAGMQYFRIRNYKDNTKPFCRFIANFACNYRDTKIPTDKFKPGEAAETHKGYLFGLKRYSDDEIILAGCGGDEYPYRRDAERVEIFREN